MDFRVRNIPTDLWVKFKNLCNDMGMVPNDRLNQMIVAEVRRYVENRDKKEGKDHATD